MFFYFICNWCLQIEETTPSNDKTYSDDLWNEVKNIFPAEKPIKTIGRPIVVFRKVLDGILCAKSWMPVEGASQGIWFWFHMS
jgi:hypothetical protein